MSLHCCGAGEWHQGSWKLKHHHSSNQTSTQYPKLRKRRRHAQAPFLRSLLRLLARADQVLPQRSWVLPSEDLSNFHGNVDPTLSSQAAVKCMPRFKPSCNANIAHQSTPCQGQKYGLSVDRTEHNYSLSTQQTIAQMIVTKDAVLRDDFPQLAKTRHVGAPFSRRSASQSHDHAHPGQNAESTASPPALQAKLLFRQSYS